MYRGIVLSICLVSIIPALVVGAVPKGRDKSLNNLLLDTKIQYHPYSVQLRNSSGDIACAGTLITPEHVLTAAHCFDQYEATDITVVAGANKKSETGVQRGIVKVTKHDTYNPTTFHNDAAVIKLDSPMELSRNVQTVGVCSMPWGYNANMAQINGWLLEDQDKFNTVRPVIYSKEECAKAWEDDSIATKLTSSMVCNGPDIRFPCTHVAGGGGLLAGDVCAIVIGGPGCADSKFPGAYTSVYEMRDFVERCTKE